jgi:hypothetical protein
MNIILSNNFETTQDKLTTSEGYNMIWYNGEFQELTILFDECDFIIEKSGESYFTTRLYGSKSASYEITEDISIVWKYIDEYLSKNKRKSITNIFKFFDIKAR